MFVFNYSHFKINFVCLMSFIMCTIVKYLIRGGGVCWQLSYNFEENITGYCITCMSLTSALLLLFINFSNCRICYWLIKTIRSTDWPVTRIKMQTHASYFFKIYFHKYHREHVWPAERVKKAYNVRINFLKWLNNGLDLSQKKKSNIFSLQFSCLEW